MTALLLDYYYYVHLERTKTNRIIYLLITKENLKQTIRLNFLRREKQNEFFFKCNRFKRTIDYDHVHARIINDIDFSRKESFKLFRFKFLLN